MGYIGENHYSLSMGHQAQTAWANSTTYYFASSGRVPSTSQGRSLLYIPVKGVITQIVYFNYSSTTTGSAEDWPLVLRLNNTTDYTIATVGAATPDRLWANYALNIPVSRGDYIEFKTVTPAWVTPPSDGSSGGGIGIITVRT